MDLATNNHWRFRRNPPLLCLLLHLLSPFYSFLPLVTTKDTTSTLPAVSLPSLATQESFKITFRIVGSLAYVHPSLTYHPHIFHLTQSSSSTTLLFQPALLRHEIVTSPLSQQTITSARYNAARILAGTDHQILIVVAPCPIHPSEPAITYAKLLKSKILE